QDIAERLLPALSKQMAESGVKLHGAETVLQVLHGPAKLVPLKPEERDNEFLALDLNVVVVEHMDGAIAHSREHGTQHS
ncbi:gamma-glutamyl-phosphate reductase, partial [Salmonella enterica subsp. enterica serovar Infantis]